MEQGGGPKNMKSAVTWNTTHRGAPDLDSVLARFDIPASFSIQAWSPNYFDAMCALSSIEGWTTPELRPKETLVAWENSWPTLVAVDTDGKLVGFLRGSCSSVFPTKTYKNL